MMSALSQVEQDTFKVYIEIKKQINSGNLDIGDYMNLVGKVVQMTEALSKLPGPGKKEIVTKVVSDLVNEIDNELMKDILTPPTVSNLIEVIILAARGKYELNKKYSKLKKCLPCCK